MKNLLRVKLDQLDDNGLPEHDFMGEDRLGSTVIVGHKNGMETLS